MNFNKETIYNLGIGGASEIRLRELIHQLRADWIEMNEELTRLKKAHSASPNANTVLGEVRAMKRNIPLWVLNKGISTHYDNGYNNAIDDVLKILNRHFT